MHCYQPITCYVGATLVWKKVVNGFALLQSLFHLGDQVNTIHHFLHQFNLQSERDCNDY